MFSYSFSIGDTLGVTNNILNYPTAFDSYNIAKFISTAGYIKLPESHLVVDLDPLQVNSNFYAAVSTLLDIILDYMECTGRKYIQCVMDGAPYGICKKLLTETYKCSICNETHFASEHYTGFICSEALKGIATIMLQLASLFYASSNIWYQEYMRHDTLYMLFIPKDIQMQIQMESSKGKIDAAESFEFLLFLLIKPQLSSKF